MRGHYRFLF